MLLPRFHQFSLIVYLSVLPISYIALKLGATPIISYVVSIFVYPIAMFCDLFIINKYTQFQVGAFLKNVLFRSVFVYAVGGMLPLYFHYNMGIYPSSLCRSHFGNKLDSKNNPLIDSLQSDFPSPNIQKRGCVHSQKSD